MAVRGRRRADDDGRRPRDHGRQTRRPRRGHPRYIVGTIEDPDTPTDEAQEGARVPALDRLRGTRRRRRRAAERSPRSAAAPSRRRPSADQRHAGQARERGEDWRRAAGGGEWNADFGKMEINDVLEKKGERVAARKATREAYERVRKQQEMERALEAAKERAVQPRAAEGAYLGAVESKPFSLPNPRRPRPPRERRSRSCAGGGTASSAATARASRRFSAAWRPAGRRHSRRPDGPLRVSGGAPVRRGDGPHRRRARHRRRRRAPSITVEAAALQASEKPDGGGCSAQSLAQFGAIRRNF